MCSRVFYDLLVLDNLQTVLTKFSIGLSQIFTFGLNDRFYDFFYVGVNRWDRCNVAVGAVAPCADRDCGSRARAVQHFGAREYPLRAG